MKVHFVFAPAVDKGLFTENWEAAMPPLGILYLAAYLRANHGVQVSCTDALRVGFNCAMNEVKRVSPDILCVSYHTHTAVGAYRFVNAARRAHPRMKVVVGGPHASALPKEALTLSQADVVVHGEGEETLGELVGLYWDTGALDADDLAQIAGISYRSRDSTIRTTAPRPHIPDLDGLPFPARDLLDLHHYRGFYLRAGSPQMTVLFSRGCPLRCTFCSIDHWKLSKPYVRTRSPTAILDEIQRVHEEYGVREIQNVSDEFNVRLDASMAICDEFKRRRLPVKWKTMVRARPLSEELVRSMADSGCWLVMLGIESGNQETLDGVRKSVTHQNIQDACNLFKRNGIKVQGLFMLFNAWESNTELRFEDAQRSRQTVLYAKDLVNRELLDFCAWSVTTPYPGSELYRMAERHALLSHPSSHSWDATRLAHDFALRLPGVLERDLRDTNRAFSTLSAGTLLRHRQYVDSAAPSIFRKLLGLL